MGWVKLDDGFPEHPKITKVGGDAGWLNVCAIAYCNRNLTNGLVARSVLTRLSDRKHPARLAHRLVEAGLWDECEDGWMIHDYLDYQPSRQEVEATHAAARERMRAKRAKPPNGAPDVRANIVGTSGLVTPEVPLPRPDPTRPLRVDLDDDSESVSEPTSSSSDSDLAEYRAWSAAVTDRAAAILCERRLTPPAAPRAWCTATSMTMRTERADDLLAAFTLGVAPELAASRLADLQPLPGEQAPMVPVDEYAVAYAMGRGIGQDHLAVLNYDAELFCADLDLDTQTGVGMRDGYRGAAEPAPSLRIIQGGT